jgi:hypothetical protein
VEMLWTTVPRSNETQLSAYIRRPGNGVRLPNAARAGRGLRRGCGRAPVSALSQFLQPLSPAAEPPRGAEGGKGAGPSVRPASPTHAWSCRSGLLLPSGASYAGWAGLRLAVSRRESWNAAEQDRGRDRRPAGGVRVKTLRIAGGTTTTLPRIQKCSCDGSGWFVSLNRDRYRSPGDAGMLRLTRCLCLEHAPSPARRGGAGAV